MADPLPPDGDSGRHKPDPNQPPSSPWLPGKAPKLAKKNPKSKGVYGKSDKKYGEDYETNDHLYGEVAKAKFKRDPRTGPNEA